MGEPVAHHGDWEAGVLRHKVQTTLGQPDGLTCPVERQEREVVILRKTGGDTATTDLGGRRIDATPCA